MHWRNSRGFTYIEMLVVTGIFILLAGIAAPNYIAIERSREKRAFKATLCQYAMAARARAINSGHVVALSFDSKGKTLKVYDEPSTGNPEELQSLDLPEGYNTVRFAADKDESTDSNWRVPFFADGTSSGGGIEFEVDQVQFSFSIKRGTGQPTIAEGPMPDLSLERWKAGGYEPRK